MKQLLLFSCILTQVFLFGQNPELEENWWKPLSPNNSTSIFVDELHESVYLSGSFTNIGRSASYGISLNTETGIPDFSYDQPDGQVLEVTSDGIGGWYIRGYFDQVGDSIRDGIAHIGADGKVTSWNPDFNSNNLTSLKCNDGILYVAGYFTAINGFERIRLASFEVTTGELTSWNPTIQGLVYSLECHESRLYLGGTITSINDEPRSLASFDLNTGELESWNPGEINGQILDIEVEDGMVYIGGTFSAISGIQRNRLASFDTSTGALSSWAPTVSNVSGVNSRVNVLEIKGDTLFVGGIFGFIDGQNRENLAAISINSNQVFGWIANVNSKVVAMTVSGNKLFIGGAFYDVSDEPRRYLASIDTNNGEVLEWNPSPNVEIFDFEISNNDVYVAGNYSVIGLLPRLKFAVLDLNTGAPKDWSPELGGNSAQVQSFAVTDDKIYIAGSFDAVNGQPRNGVAEFDPVSGELLDWNPFFDGPINDLLIHENQLFVAGSFITVNGISRNRLASFDLNTGDLLDWNPVVNGPVNDLVNSGDSLFLAGDFSSIGGQTRLRIAAINTDTGLPYDWIVDVDDAISSMAIDNSFLYFGGIFDEVNGLERDGIAAVDKNNAVVSSWSTESGPGNVIELAAAGNSIFVIGYFSGINGESHNRFVELDKITAAPSDWNPILTGYPGYLVTSQNKLFLSGSIQTEEGGDKFCVYSPLCNYPTLPSFEIDELTICIGGSVSLNVGNGQLNDGIIWKWYTGSCGGVEIETGNQIEVTPLETTTYYVRGEGGCTVVSECATITVNVIEDLENPSITAPADIVVNTTEGLCAAVSVVLGEAFTEDNCQVLSVTEDAPDSFDLGTTAVTWTVTDGNGNVSNAVQMVTVVDAESPTITNCPSDILITSNEPSCEATVTWDEPIGLDNCSSSPVMTSNWESGSMYPFGNTEVVYTVADDAGNEITCSFNVEVVSDIEANTTYADVSCNGDTDGFIDLNLSGGQGEYIITWNGPNGFFSNDESVDELAPGIYTAEITIDGGCNTAIQVDVNEPDALSLIYNANTVTSDSDGYITCNAIGGISPYTFSWTGPNGYTSDQRDIYGLTEAGSYFVMVVDANGCEFVQEVYLDSTVGIGDVGYENFSVYPNPNNGQLYIESPSILVGEEIYITNILGERVYSDVIGELISNVNMEQYTSGVYLIYIGSINQPVKVIKF